MSTQNEVSLLALFAKCKMCPMTAIQHECGCATSKIGTTCKTKGDTGSRVTRYCSIPYSVRKMLCFVMMFPSMLQFFSFAFWAENILSDKP